MACLCFVSATITSCCVVSSRRWGDASSADRALDTLLWIDDTVFVKFSIVVGWVVVDNLFQMTKELCSLSLSCCLNNRFGNIRQMVVGGKAGPRTNQMTKTRGSWHWVWISIPNQSNKTELLGTTQQGLDAIPPSSPSMVFASGLKPTLEKW